MIGPDRLAAVVLAAGAGDRLWPLTRYLPKALCPVGNVPLVDHGIARVRSIAQDVAVNVHAGRPAMCAHLGDRVHVEVEERLALGTAGAVGNLRDWIDGREVVVTNADAWLGGPPTVDLASFAEGWDRARVRLLCIRDPNRGDFGELRYAGVCLLPADAAKRLEPEPSGLYEVLWRAEHEAGRLDLVEWDGPFIDCGTPADYLAANLAWSDGRSVVAPGVQVDGDLDRCVVWEGAHVPEGMSFSRAVIGPGWSVLVR